MLRAVIFDMDGVLVDSHPVHIKAWRRLLESVGRPISDSELEFILDGRTRTDILRHFLGELTESQLLEYGRRKEALFYEAVDEVAAMEGVFDFLEELDRAGIPKGVSTSASSLRAQFLLEMLNLKQRFTAIVTGDDVGDGKPDPEIFRLAANSLDADPASVVVVEDAPAGVRGARAAGMKCLGIASPERLQLLRDAGADLTVSHFRDVSLSQLQQLCASPALV